MRLTNIAQATLPPGAVHSYALRPVGPRGRALPVSFDQGRHVGAGDRPGSWMSIALRLPVGTTRDALAAAWQRTVSRHGTFRSVFGLDDAGRPTLHEVTLGDGTWETHPVPEAIATREVVRELFDVACRPLADPSHRMVVIEPDTAADDPRPCVVLGADHAHVDMWSLVVVARDLIAYLDAAAGQEGADDLPDAPPFAEHTAALAERGPAPAAVIDEWAAIMEVCGGEMPRFPLPVGEPDPGALPVVEVREVMDAAEYDAFTRAAKAGGTSTIGLAMSALTEVTRRLAAAPLRAVFPVHSRHEPRWHDSSGWFITNSVLECDDDAPTACAAAVKRAITLGSHPLAPILEPYGGMRVPRGMFALSWLDTRRLPAELDDRLDAQYVSAVGASDDVMLWFVVNRRGLHLRCRYPDTDEAVAAVGGWLDAVVDAFLARIPDTVAEGAVGAGPVSIP
ncbi:peptide synthetase [Microbacterium xanthum]|uniref:peptide synthetase n=1 Tax=Microbacterium xanthum TaxID=3079794 RepID=UPI002AD31021|nr:peptide synthetase [Microbacterium sp. KSW-48]MDZ8172925.1 peptide synthetase [Microbacterium sp. KSW-48]